MDRDDEYSGNDSGNDGGLSNEELSLPKATITKMIQEMLPNDIVCAKETRDLIIDCCIEFIHLIASEANDSCEQDNKKTISPEHVTLALQNLGFQSYIEPVKASYEDHKLTSKERDRKQNSRLDKLGISEDQLLLEQEALFEKARLKYLAAQNPVGESSENQP